MPTILDYGLLADAIYADQPGVPGWTVMAFRPGQGTGLQAAVFTRARETVVAFKGTSQAMDVVADLKIGLGINTSMFSQAESFVARHAAGEGVVVTGHSLGGAIAQTVGNRRRLPFVSFNAPGVALLASQNLTSVMPVLGIGRLVLGATIGAVRHPMQTMRDIGSAFHDSLGVNYRLSGDLVSAYGLHYGPIVHLQGQGDPLTQHRMTTMNAVLERFGYRNIAFPV
jgi:hypothetical protein